MNTLERLRPEISPLDPQWSAATLETIFSGSVPSRSRRRPTGRRVALVGAMGAGLLGISGVAYAAGLVPAVISDELEWISPSSVSDVHEVASFTTERDGKTRTFEIWRGINAHGQSCTAVLEAMDSVGPEFGGYCSDSPTDAAFDRTTESYKMGDTPPPATYFVYGEPAIAGVTTVRVVGAGFDHSVAVDPETGGYAVALPELGDHVSGHFATAEFIDAEGVVLGTRELREK